MTVVSEKSPLTLPRENLVRLTGNDFEVREEDGAMPTLFGHFTRYNEWTEINSMWEGRFLERIAPGSFKKTFKENAANIRCLFQHGRDPQIGDKPLGPIRTLREESEGPFYEVPLLDVDYNRSLVPGLKENLYGASFRMQVLREEISEEPGRSDSNPDGIPERTIKEVRLYEFGPVTFPAYPNATAGVRSLTDWWIVDRVGQDDQERLRNLIFDQLAADPDRLRELLRIHDEKADEAPTDTAAAASSTAADDTDVESSNDEREDDNTNQETAAPSDSEAGNASPTSLVSAARSYKPLRGGRSKPSWKLGN